MTQFTQRFSFDLTDTLAGNPKHFTYFFKCTRTSIIKSKAESQDIFFTVS